MTNYSGVNVLFNFPYIYPNTFSVTQAGSIPSSMLVADAQGNLFGTTVYGGSYTGPNYAIFGYGTIFELSNTGFAAGGSSQSAPVFPTSKLTGSACSLGGFAGDECFEFDGATTNAWYDPVTANGYNYRMLGSSLFTGVMDFPTGFARPFDVSAPGCSIPGAFSPGQSVDFVALCGHGVSSFSVTGIEPMFDPTNSAAFPIELAFNTLTADFLATPLTESVPEPPPTLLFGAILCGVGLFRLRAPKLSALRAVNAGL